MPIRLNILTCLKVCCDSPFFISTKTIAKSQLEAAVITFLVYYSCPGESASMYLVFPTFKYR